MPYCLTDGSLEQFFFCSSTAYPTVRVPHCSMAGTTASLWGHTSPPPVDDFANVPRTVDYSRYRPFFRSSMAFMTVCAPYCSANVSADRPIFRLSTAFTTDGTRYCSADGSGWQQIAHSSARQRLSRRFALYCSADGSGLLILALVNGFHDGFRAIFLSGWRQIVHSFSRQRLSRRFARRIAQRMVADCSYFRSSKAFTTDCAPYCSADGSALFILLLVNYFSNGLRAVLLRG